MRVFLKYLLKPEKDFKVIGETQSGIETIEFCRKNSPDLVLIDINMDYQMDGLEAIQTIRLFNSDIKFVVLTVFDDERVIVDAFKTGADSYLLKSASVIEIISTIQDTVNNSAVITSEVGNRLKKYLQKPEIENSSHYIDVIRLIMSLTATEIEIIRLKKNGLSSEMICQKKHIEMGTVRTHINNILKKFQMEKMQDVVFYLNSISFFGFIDQALSTDDTGVHPC